MARIPLFPLGSVLFPGVPLQLHIFEPRYQALINECLTRRLSFGVVLIKEGHEAMGPLAKPHMYGCSAEILQVENLEEGRKNISTVGSERFKVQELFYDRPYLMGEVEFCPLRDAEGQDLTRTARRIKKYVANYLKILGKAGKVRFDLSKVPKNPVELGHLAAYVLQAPAATKQQLLEVELASEFLELLEQIYRRETAILELLVQDSEPNGSALSLN
jgi:Lon protease-like protein